MMAEIREALPYIKKMKFTSKTLTTVTPQQLTNGDMVGVQNVDYPGLVVEVVHYIAPDTPSPAEVLVFPRKAFYQEQLAILEAIENKDNTTQDTIDKLQTILNNPKTIWLETIEAAAGVPSIESAFASAYSEALDYFESLKEPEAPIGGRKTYLGLMQWEASIPFEKEAKKSLSIRVGIYLEQEMKGKPAVKELFFEDGANKRERELNIANYTTGIANLTTAKTSLERIKVLRATEPKTPEVLAELEAFTEQLKSVVDIDSELVRINNDITFKQIEIDRLNALQLGNLASFMQKPAMATTVPTIGLTVFSVLKQASPDWANLNLQLVQQKFAYPDMT